MLKLFKYIKPYIFWAVLAPLLMIVEVAADLTQPLLMAQIIDNGIANNDLAFVFKTGMTMLGVTLIALLGGFGCTVASSIASQSFGANLRSVLFEKIHTFSFRVMDKFEISSLITRLTNDVVQIQNVVLMSLRIVVRAPLMAIGGVIMAVSINPKLSSIVLMAIPVLSGALWFVMTKGMPLFSIVQKRLDKVNGVMRENLIGVRVVKAFVRRNFEQDRFETASLDLKQTTVKASRIIMIIMPVMMLVMNFSIIAVLWFGSRMYGASEIDIGQIVAFITYMTQILMSLLMVAFILVMLSRAKASADRINEILDQDDFDDVHIIDELKSDFTQGDIEFRDVSFKYSDNSEYVLKNINFTIKQGQTVGILGGTGSGKSTLISLIPRLYIPTSGKITISGKDIQQMNMQKLREKISVVLQESVLFSGTIEENIKWGDSKASHEQVVNAAVTAQADEFIQKMSDKYDSKVEQRAVNLSGGQKQRLSIARAVIKEPHIMILDDATSAVDVATESKIQKSFRAIKNHPTTIIVAQRISSVMDADMIIILEDGEIDSIGNHDELIKKSTIYKEIYQTQLGEEAVNG